MPMEKLQPPRGMADLMPEAMCRHQYVIDIARHVSQQFGFAEMATPIVEFSEVFARPLGEASDVVTKETYHFTDRAGDSLTLRPEATASVVRALISNGLTQTLPQKFFYAGPMFRYERPQKGRMRQFHQIGVELLGAEGATSDADIIIMAQEMLVVLGVADKCVLHINSLGDAESRELYRQALVGYMTKHKADLSADSKTRLATNPLRILDSKDKGDQAILKNAPDMEASMTAKAKARFDSLLGLLEAAGIGYTINQRLVRGLDYYSHTVFEFITEDLGAQGAVLAGGRYDGLATMLGSGVPIPGVGWAAGVDRLALLIDAPAVPRTHAMLIGLADKHMASLLPVAQAMRDAGLIIETAYGEKLDKSLRQADRVAARFAIIVGDDEAKKDIALIRNMTDGSQTEVAINKLAAKLIELCQAEDKHDR